MKAKNLKVEMNILIGLLVVQRFAFILYFEMYLEYHWFQLYMF